MSNGMGPWAFNPPERRRVYLFPNEETVTIDGVSELYVAASGNHKLKTTNGMHYIVSKGWLSIALDIDDWSI